jgi:epoxyqueuosine reductase
LYQSAELSDSLLTANGLNLQAVFNIHELPEEILSALESTCVDYDNYGQLILLGHGGKTLWHALEKSAMQSDNPVDDFSIRTIQQFFQEQSENHQYQIIYPGDTSLDLQQLGQLAGWHHPSPFKVGINKQWGSWFAYRAAILTNTHYKASHTIIDESPCNSCSNKPCIKACPGLAIDEDGFKLETCVNFRKQAASICRHQCLARCSCPVAENHRYSEAQMHYHYSVSMRIIEEFY